MDETSTRELVQDLRATRGRLEAAQEDAAALKVLLALRTHQHDLAWQGARRLEAELAAVRAVQVPPAAAPAPDASAAAEILARADERTEAVRTVLGAVLDCIGPRALDKRRFKDLIARAGRDVPDEGPGAARHAVLLSEARRVLGLPG